MRDMKVEKSPPKSRKEKWWLSPLKLRNSDQKRWEMLLQEELQHFSLFSVRWSLLKDGMCNVLCTINRSLVELFLKSWSRFIEVEESCSDDVSARALLDERSISKDQGFEDSIAFFKTPKKKAFESFLTTFQNCMFSNLRYHWSKAERRRPKADRASLSVFQRLSMCFNVF